MTDLDELRQMARNPQHYSNYTLAGALHGVLDRVGAEVERLRQENDLFRDTLEHYANKDNWRDDGDRDAWWFGDCDDGWEFAQAALQATTMDKATDDQADTP